MSGTEKNRGGFSVAHVNGERGQWPLCSIPAGQRKILVCARCSHGIQPESISGHSAPEVHVSDIGAVRVLGIDFTANECGRCSVGVAVLQFSDISELGGIWVFQAASGSLLDCVDLGVRERQSLGVRYRGNACAGRRECDGREGYKNGFHKNSLDCALAENSAVLVEVVKAALRGTAGGGVPSVTSADRGQACLQVAPNPSLSNLGRVGANCAARPAFLGVFHG